MGKSRFIIPVALVFLCAAVAVLTAACSSSNDPTSSISQGKGVVRGTVNDEGGQPVQGAVILVDGSPVAETNENGEFAIELEPGTYRIEAQEGGQTLWSLQITIEEGEDNDVTGNGDDVEGDDVEGVDNDVEVLEGQNGIGPCVSECVHTYGPPNPDPDADPLFSGKFNAKPCVDFCKATNYRGGASKGADGRCNEFYRQSDPDCGPWPDGFPCRTDAVCESGYCADDVCADAPLKENGEACSENGECASGTCHDDSMCGLPLGETCTDGDECRSGECGEDAGIPPQTVCLEP